MPSAAASAGAEVANVVSPGALIGDPASEVALESREPRDQPALGSLIECDLRTQAVEVAHHADELRRALDREHPLNDAVHQQACCSPIGAPLGSFDSDDRTDASRIQPENAGVGAGGPRGRLVEVPRPGAKRAPIDLLSDARHLQSTAHERHVHTPAATVEHCGW